jgi:hypothetical protein
VIIGVAISLSAVQMVNRESGIQAIPLSEYLLFFAFIITLVPFYHGALRHLDDAYLENPNPQIRNGALIVDILLLIAHGMVFVVLALLLDKPSEFAWILLGLIAIDVIWGAFVYFGASTQGPGGAEGKWALINFIFVLLSAVMLIILNITFQSDVDATKMSFSVLVACLIRTLVDYIACWDFYFPND